jgi:hypothetical protein
MTITRLVTQSIPQVLQDPLGLKIVGNVVAVFLRCIMVRTIRVCYTRLDNRLIGIDAIENGWFDDDDAAGVSGLDTLDGGNAHRISNQATRASFGQLRNSNRAHDAMGTYSQRPKYDPRYELRNASIY